MGKKCPRDLLNGDGLNPPIYNPLMALETEEEPIEHESLCVSSRKNRNYWQYVRLCIGGIFSSGRCALSSCAVFSGRPSQ